MCAPASPPSSRSPPPSGAPRKGCASSCATRRPLDEIKSRLTARGEGEISLVVTLERPASEVEIKLPGGYSVSPDIAGALMAIPGVLAVEHV